MDFSTLTGATCEVKMIVGKEDTAATYGSGAIEVFASPVMFGLMESAALKAVANDLPDGYSTVGIRLDVEHLAPSPVGMEVRAMCELLEVEGKKLTFKVEAYDEVELIGRGTHIRYIVDFEKFSKRALSKGK